MALIKEHSITLRGELPAKDAHRKMPVFYNPVMSSNRNISILVLRALPHREMNIADPLAGSGIRSLRFLNELPQGKIKQLAVNDAKEHFPKTFQENARLNKIGIHQGRVTLSNQEASLFLLQAPGFDYIDIDPFGSPNPFLAAAVTRIARNGILAITATDTAALTGTYPKVTQRKYWATPLRNYLMHEIGLRILIRKIQLQGVQFEKALVPILSYSKDHYYRIYFKNEKGKKRCDDILQQHQYFLYCPSCAHFETSRFNKDRCSFCQQEYLSAGPLWTGPLADPALLEKMIEHNPYPEEQQLLELLQQESSRERVGFYDAHEIAKKRKREPPRLEPFLKKVQGVRTHFSPTGFKTKKEYAEIVKLFQKENNSNKKNGGEKR